MSQSTSDRRLIRRVRIRNYRNIAACDVELPQLAMLVGPNGAGKSNFVDALCFVAESLRPSLDEALLRRRGFREVARRTLGRPGPFGIRLDYSIKDASGYFAVAIAGGPDGAYRVKREECLVEDAAGTHFYAVEDARVKEATFTYPPPASDTLLYLVRASTVLEFMPVYQALAEMSFYKLNPDSMRGWPAPDSHTLLRPDGSNVAEVLGAIAKRSPETKERLDWYLQAVVPGVVSVDKQTFGPGRTLLFRQQSVREGNRFHRFFGNNMSDGTMRTVGLLVALLQNADSGDGARRLVAVEEPETALHPGALDIVREVLADGADWTQVIATSQSADLLDHPDVPVESIVAVMADDGDGRFGPIDDVGKSVVASGSFSIGELMRAEQLRPDETASRLRPSQVRLFGKAASR